MFGRKKMSAIDRRLKELRREMSEVSGEIKDLSRYEKDKDAAAEPPGFALRYADSAPQTAEGVGAFAAPVPEAAENLSPPELKNDQTDLPRPPDSASGEEGALPLFERRPPISSSGREKFANYFMAGHFHNLRPLRVEKRIVRNKALFMIVLAVLALIWLVFLLNSQ